MLSSVIIGGGPGGLGPILWAAQHGLLPQWLDRGVAVVERQAHLGGTLGRFGINSIRWVAPISNAWRQRACRRS